MKKEALWTKNFVAVSVANFFLFISYYALLVTLPAAAMNDLQSSSSIAGLFTTIFLAAAIIIRPFVGSWIDRFGKRFVLLISYLLFTLVSLMYGFFHSVIILLILRFLQGLGFGLATASAGGVAADVIPDSRKGEGLGYFVMSNNLAMVIGPFLGITFYSKYGLMVLFAVAFVCSLFGYLCGMLIKTPKQEQTRNVSPEKQPMFEKGAVPYGIIAGFLGIAYSGILSFMAVFAAERGMETESSYFFLVFAIVLLLSRPFTGRWYDRYGADFVVYPCIISFGLGLLTLGLSNGALLFFLSAALVGVGWGTLFSSFQTLAIQNSNPKRTSTATATYLSVFDVGIGGGSFIAGLLVNYMDLGTMFILFSIYSMIGIGIFYWIRKDKAKHEHQDAVQHATDKLR